MYFLKSKIKLFKTYFTFIIISVCLNIHSQNNPIKKLIFVPHPRSDDKVNQSVIKAIEQTDFSIYDMILLGGDLTYYTTISQKSIDYCDSIFNLGSENTLWAVGNHDLNNKSLIIDYTHRPTFYTYTKDNITFLVLDTEIDSKNFNSSFISGEQLNFIKELTDTISKSDYLILLHHRLIWMIGNEDLAGKIDSVGASTRELDTTNFYQEVYPLLQKAKKNGVKILCLGGDRADINIEYTAEDSITFLASTMVPAFDDNTNHVIILNHEIDSGTINWNFIPLSELDKNKPDTNIINIINNSLFDKIKIYPNPSNGDIYISNNNLSESEIIVQVFNLSGILVYSEIIELNKNYYTKINFNKKGIYLFKTILNNEIYFEIIIIK